MSVFLTALCRFILMALPLSFVPSLSRGEVLLKDGAFKQNLRFFHFLKGQIPSSINKAEKTETTKQAAAA